MEAVLEGRELGRELGGLRSGVIHVAAGIPDLIASALGSLLGRLKLVDDLLERGGEIGPVVPKDNRPFGDGRELSDAQLLAAIRTDLARSPFHGEGHRKVHARRRILDGIRVARTRVLRVMRAHGLLSPHRGRQGAAKTHDGRVITQAPNVMWGTDGVRVFTLDDGWGWIFAAVEHWTAEYVGRHVCKVGSRFAALDPIAQGLERLYGSLDADVARGLALRMDHGSQDLSDHFLKQIRYWGIHPASALSRNRKRTVWRSGGIVRSRSKRSTAESFRTSRPSAPPWPTSGSGTTRPGVSRSLGITRRSRRARSMSYARRHSTNVCPGNRVRYSTMSLENIT